LILDTFAGIALLILVATWIGYPAAVWTLGRLIPATAAAPWAEEPSVSIVLASRAAFPDVQARIDNMLQTAYEATRLEVIVALDRPRGPDDVTLAEWGNRVRILSSAGQGKAAALNAAVAAASGDVIVFADTFQRFEAEAIPALVAALADPRVGAASGCLHIPEGRATLSRAYWKYERWLRRCEARIHSTVGVTGAIWAMRRDLWQPLPDGLLCDDLYAPMRVVLAGHRIEFVEAAGAYELRENAPANEFRRKVRTLTGVIQVCAWLPAVLVPWRNPIWSQFALHKLARMLTPYALTALLVWSIAKGSVILSPLLPVLLTMGALAAAWALFGRNRSARRLRDLVIEGVLLQAAVVIGGVNGVRGRWEVWHG
jgi:cellulose synthase/poly-beta-1,6-N-acetylglucosamine synthase-like glycosyltransferase